MKKLAIHYQNHKRSFSRATISSVAATVADFGALYCLVEFAHIYYVAAVAMAALGGALTNFTLNRYWAFEHQHGQVTVQGYRYAIVSGISLLLNTALVFFFTEFAHLMYLTSKVIAALTVGWAWNYPMHRYYVWPLSEKKVEPGTQDDGNKPNLGPATQP